jgi:NAD-dependent deacetylase
VDVPDRARIRIDHGTRVLVVTGAGISAESGLATFRGAAGLWEGQRVEDVATPRGFAADPALVWRFYSGRRAAALASRPNAAHRALTALERQIGDRFLLVTQNVDGLHRRAGSERLVEIHGSLFRTRCSRCSRPPFADEALHESGVPSCERCAAEGRRAYLRPDIVWFDELLDGDHLRQVEAFAETGPGERLVFVAVGTSGNVWPVAGFVDLAAAAGGETWLVNLDPAQNDWRFDHLVRGPAGEVLPAVLGVGE